MRFMDIKLARKLARRSPVRTTTPAPAPYNTGQVLGPNCYSWALGIAERLQPGSLAGVVRGDPSAPNAGCTEQEQRHRFLRDGLLPLQLNDLANLAPDEWIVSMHQAPSLDFHFRRLDRDGWSEKPGDHDVDLQVRARPWWRLLRASSDKGRYRFAGFYRVQPARIHSEDPLPP